MEIRKGKAIWSCTGETGVDLYKIFTRDFEYTPGNEAAVLEISAASTFVVRLNGVRCVVDQLADFPGDITVSSCDVSGLLRQGSNNISIEVHYMGKDFLTVRQGPAYVQAVIACGNRVICATDSSWLWADMCSMEQNRDVVVTMQLGFTCCCDARCAGTEVFNHNAVEVPGHQDWQYTMRQVPPLLELAPPAVTIVQQGFLKRLAPDGRDFAKLCYNDYLVPCKGSDFFTAADENTGDEGVFGFFQRTRPQLSCDGVKCRFTAIAEEKKADGYYIILDLGRETVGYFTMNLDAPAGTIVDICHGEHLSDGRVRSTIGARSFADRYICKEGSNEFTYYHRRLGARYIELHFTNIPAQGVIALDYAGLIPLELPLPAAARFTSADRLTAKINQVSVDTLKLCMHEHYEDCPWREQGLYAYDSRNQILYGYYVWGNYDFVGASLELLGKSFDGERYLELTSPGRMPLTIPVFTLVWISELKEHLLYSGSDRVFAKYRDTVDKILAKALDCPAPGNSGLYHPGTDKKYWNFCEWNGKLSGLDADLQAPYNIYLYEALNSAAELHRLAGDAAKAEYYSAAAAELGKAVEKCFYDAASKCYLATSPAIEARQYEHIQAIMLANNLVPAEKVEALLDHFENKTLCGIDLSALRYLICGLHSTGSRGAELLKNYLQEILDPIVLSGATSLWETRFGDSDFDMAGSLCHAWSSVMPYYCGSIILGVTPITPGFAKFRVKPYCAALPAASGEIPTPCGNIEVSWEMRDGKMDITVIHPAGTEPVLEGDFGKVVVRCR